MREEIELVSFVKLGHVSFIPTKHLSQSERPEKMTAAATLLAFTSIALRGLTRPDARVASQVLQLQDQTIGLLAEILQVGRMRGDLAPGLDVLEASRTLFHITQGARIPWLNGAMSDEACLEAIQQDVAMLFRGIGAPPEPPR